MSNNLVGGVYQRIIDDVIDTCHVTFEEDGVDQSTLEDLRKSWQKNLSSKHIATMPWDPAPAPVLANPTPLPPSAVRTQSQSLPMPTSTNPPSSSVQSHSNSGVQIKSEPSTGYDIKSVPQSNGGLAPNYPDPASLIRASQQIKEKFGEAAQPQVNQLQARAAMAAQASQGQSRPQPQARPQYSEEQQRQMDEKRRQYALQQRQLQQQQYQNHLAQQQSTAVNNTQTDGAADWDSMVAQRRAEAQAHESGTYDADLSIREQVEKMSRKMEGGGLMAPLSEYTAPPTSKNSKKGKTVKSDTCREAVSAHHGDALNASKVVQFDGADESDEDDKTGIKDDPGLDDDDENAINSDLDDPDDNVVDETEGEGNGGEIMLCTYDKVQRVKNKWKCTLKDGVLTTGGKEYVFHKAQGEFEW